MFDLCLWVCVSVCECVCVCVCVCACIVCTFVPINANVTGLTKTQNDCAHNWRNIKNCLSGSLFVLWVRLGLVVFVFFVFFFSSCSSSSFLSIILILRIFCVFLLHCVLPIDFVFFSSICPAYLWRHHTACSCCLAGRLSLSRVWAAAAGNVACWSGMAVRFFLLLCSMFFLFFSKFLKFLKNSYNSWHRCLIVMTPRPPQ